MTGVLPYRSVLVTGGGGFVGSYLLAGLHSALPPGAKLVAPSRHDNAETRLELNDAPAVVRLVTDLRPDLIFHLAAQSSVGASTGNAAETWQTNVVGTLNLAQAVASAAPEATFVFVSSSEVYGAAFNAGSATEATTPLPLSPYARTKHVGEQLLGDVLASTNRLRIFRPGNHSGPGQDSRFVIPAFANQVAMIEKGKIPPVIKVGSLAAMRDFLDVRDVVTAYCAVLKQSTSAPRETFNIGSGEAKPIGELLDKLLRMARVPIRVEQDPERLRTSDVPCAQIDVAKLRDHTKWQPRYGLTEMIVGVLNDYRRRHGVDC